MQDPLGPNTLRLIDLALEEDTGRGDVTTRLTVPAGAMGAGRVIAKADAVISGLAVFEATMRRVDDRIAVERRAQDGDRAERNAVILTAAGPLASLLIAERTALNFLQRLSGVATLTRRFVDALPPGSKAVVADTRKTTPGMRALEKLAVLHGGGRNHRADLASGVLIKENHIAAAGSLAAAIARCKEGAPHTIRVEVEVQSEEDLAHAIDAGADAVLLDNMDAEEIRRCVAAAAGRVVLEASGGVTLATMAEIAAAGVDVISVGALTHSAPAADLSFLLEGA
ncbi:MAG: carboxylating nicotinate-nucleotide diphosphorylase [Proteobacteria bacterium]|jgi:nicotinate-nucleotide pyrophosphorylase (carboxylating)|nr:carboxylating nicotinate-nucleotide diphosphorylase [Pseudomonadota bacterium]